MIMPSFKWYCKTSYEFIKPKGFVAHIIFLKDLVVTFFVFRAFYK